jgi:hypothetical protein
MALQLVRQDLTEAAMFTAKGEAVQWAEVLYHKPVLVLRGSFNPVTKATLDVLERALEQFVREPDLNGETPVVLMEMTLRQLTTGERIDETDFLNRADMLSALGKTVLLSNFRRFHRLAAYLSRYTKRPIGLALGASKLGEIFDESFYNESEGGLLGGLGQLFKNPTRLYVYPHLDLDSGHKLSVDNFPVPPHLKHLYAHLVENRFIQGTRNLDANLLSIRSRDVLARIQSGDASWEQSVPQLMGRLGLAYYAGLLSAARLHGVAHQAPMVFETIVAQNRPAIRCGRVGVEIVARRRRQPRGSAGEARTSAGRLPRARAGESWYDRGQFTERETPHGTQNRR